MIFGLLFLGIVAAVLFFAAIGIKVTIEQHQNSHALDFVRDILKYIALFLAVIFFCFGVSGLVAQLIDPNNVAQISKEETARWLSFVVVGAPVVLLLARWIKRDFTKNLEDIYRPAWQLYLLFSSTFTFAIWFLFLIGSIADYLRGSANPRGLASGIVAFVVWLIHFKLLKIHNSLLVNLHRFIGWFAGITATLVAIINVIDVAIRQVSALELGRFQLQEAIITAAIAVPTALFYWQDFETHANALEARIYRTFAGQAIPALFATIAATVAVNAIITWSTGAQVYWQDVSSTSATVMVLLPTILFFRRLVNFYERDEITRIFQYLICGLAMVGLAISIGALVAGILDSSDNKDAIIFAASLALTTFPTWFKTWKNCQFAMATEFESEHSSPIRRFYLYALIGVPTIIALGASVFVVFNFFKALLIGGLDRIQLSTPLGVLISMAVVALYHSRVQRKEFS